MNKLYTITIRYFLLMVLMLLITGIWMVLLNSSSNIESLTDHYVKKSLYGILEIVTPHLFAMGTIIFILTHFLSLKNKNSIFESKLTLTLFTVMLISNLSMFLISQTIVWVVWLKILSVLLFILLTLVTMWRVLLRDY